MNDPVIRNLNFSQFHPLDHWIWERRCREFYGGWRIHLKYGWDFKWRARLHEETLCRLGFHKFKPGFHHRASGKHWTACVYCWKHLPGSEYYE